MLSSPAQSVSADRRLFAGVNVQWPARFTWLSSRYFTLVLLTLSLPFICLVGRPLYGDVWWVIASGRALVDQGQLLQTDPLTFAPHTATYFDVQWLAQLAYFKSYQLLGFEGVALFNALAVSVTFGILLKVAVERSQNVGAATVSILLTELTALWFLHPRAQTFGFVAFAATLWLLSRSAGRWWHVVAIAGVQALWANLHGSFFLGPALTVILLTGEAVDGTLANGWRSVLQRPRTRLLLAALAAQSAGSLATPYGPNIVTYLLKFSGDPVIRQHIAEWLPTNASDFPGAEFFASVALILAVLGLARSRVATSDLLLLGLFGVLGTQAYRNIPWWGLASGPILATYLARVQVPDRLARIGNCLITSRRQMRGNVMRGVLIAAVLVAALPWMKAANPWLGDDQKGMIATSYPEAAASYLLGAHVYGPHVFSDHAWSSYLDWRLFPTYQQMMDPSIEVHPGQVWTDILTLNQGHVTWEELADKYAIDVLLLSPETQPLLITAAERSPRWQSLYNDGQSVIFVRA